MRTTLRNSVVGIALGAALALLPMTAGAVGYEDSLDDCAYPRTFDLLVMRPISFASLAVGTVLWLPLAPIAYATVPDDVGQVSEDLIYNPARFTFERRLGECVGTTLSY